jgi:hypothetical protein
VDLDRQAIERRDFPIARRGYDASAVDAHLRALAVEVEELQRKAMTGGTGESMASSAGTHVQSIIEAAEASAAEIERQAGERARQVREEAERDAELMRQEAIETARGQVGAIGQVAASLLERVGGMDSEARALVESLRTGASRLAGDLAAVEASMAELYDAASGQGAQGVPSTAPAASRPPAGARAPGPPAAPSVFEAELAGAMGGAVAGPEHQFVPDPLLGPEPELLPDDGLREPPSDPARSLPGAGDVDGARLVALNMALNGETRADTERYLAENFELADQAKLLDEVYAAIEG